MSCTSWLRGRHRAGAENRSARNRRRPPPGGTALRFRPQIESLEDRNVPSSLSVAAPLAPPVAGTQARGAEAYGQLPLSFEANQGQTDAQVNFLSRGSGYSLFLTPGEAVLALHQGSGSDAVLRMQLVDGNPVAHAVGLDRQPGASNYLIGNDPAQWHTGIANYGRVADADVYPGIDLVYYGNQRQLEYDFILAPGADPQAVRLSFQGADGLSLDSGGNLLVHTTAGDLVEYAPMSYQESDGSRRPVSGRYILERDGLVGFQVGAYDHTRPLVIDPLFSLVYSTFLGGSGNEYGDAIAVDGAGNAYMTGYTTSNDFPTKNPAQAGFAGGGKDVFVTKLNAAGGLAYSTFLGGSMSDVGTGIAVFTDPSGNTFAAVTGSTASSNFPTKNGVQAAFGGGLFDGFVAELNPSGSGLVYSTYLGGSGKDNAPGSSGSIAMDTFGNAYVSGDTTSPNFPLASPFQPSLAGLDDAFVTKLSPAGAFVYSTYLGGTGSDGAFGIAVDTSGNAGLTGYTWSTDFPTTPGAFQTTTSGGNVHVFVTKLNAAASGLIYSTYLGGSGEEKGYGIAEDPSGNAYVTGYTGSTDFPTTTGAFQPTRGGNTGRDAFVTALNATGAALVYSSYLGGTADDTGYAIAVGGDGSAYVTGETASTNFGTVNALQPTYGGGSDAFVTKVNPAGAARVYSTYLGGSDWDRGQGIAVDAGGNAYVTGLTYSANFPTKNPMQSLINGRKGGKSGTTSDAFVAKIDPPLDAASAAASSLTAGAAGANDSFILLPAARPNAPSFYLGNIRAPRSNEASLRTDDLQAFLRGGNVYRPDYFNTAPLDGNTGKFEQPSQPMLIHCDAGLTPVPQTGRPAQVTSAPTELVDDVFARGNWLADVLRDDPGLTWIP